MAKVIAIANQKGGVGKTTTAVNLSSALVKQGYSVLAIDLDAQSNLTACFGIDGDSAEETIDKILIAYTSDTELPADYGIIYHDSGVDLLPSSINLAAIELQLLTAISREHILKSYIDRIRDSYDYIIIDCSPSLSILTLNAFTAADSVIIPTLSQHLSAIGLSQLITTIYKVKRTLNRHLQIDGILLTMFSAKTNLAKNTKAQIENAYGEYINIFDVTIPQSVKAAEAGTVGKSVIDYAPSSKAAIAYMELSKEIGGAAK